MDSENSTSTTDSEEFVVTFGESEKGRRIVYYKGYVFHFHRESTSHSTWRCAKHSTTKCNSLLKTDGARVIEENSHIHLPNPTEIPKREFMKDLKRAASGSTEPPSRIIGAQLQATQSELKPHLPQSPALRRLVSKKREISDVKVKSPPNLAALTEIPEKFRTLDNGKLFLQLDSGEASGNSRFLMFGTEDTLAWLSDCKEMFVDGTFRAAPAIFHQLLVVIGLKDGKSFPAVYVLMPNKQQVMYENVWREIKKLCPALKPDVIMTDFEQASINSLKSNFKNSRQRGCFFHFSQSVIRHCQNIGEVWSGYLNDCSYSLEIRKLLGLGFVPSDKVVEYFDELMKTPFFSSAYEDDEADLDNNTASLKNLLVYFETTWVRRFVRGGRSKAGLYPIDLWNCYESTKTGWARTNNFCESFNNSFNSILCSSHPTLWKFIEDLKIKHEITIKDLLDVSTGQDGNHRKRKRYTDYNQRLVNTTENFENTAPMKYLENIAHLIVPK